MLTEIRESSLLPTSSVSGCSGRLPDNGDPAAGDLPSTELPIPHSEQKMLDLVCKVSFRRDEPLLLPCSYSVSLGEPASCFTTLTDLL